MSQLKGNSISLSLSYQGHFQLTLNFVKIILFHHKDLSKQFTDKYKKWFIGIPYCFDFKFRDYKLLIEARLFFVFLRVVFVRTRICLFFVRNILQRFLDQYFLKEKLVPADSNYMKEKFGAIYWLFISNELAMSDVFRNYKSKVVVLENLAPIFCKIICHLPFKQNMLLY